MPPEKKRRHRWRLCAEHADREVCECGAIARFRHASPHWWPAVFSADGGVTWSKECPKCTRGGADAAA